MATISEFIALFAQNHERYAGFAERLETLCRQRLRNTSFSWQSRVKARESLEEKLRNRSHTYQTEAEKISNIRDLVGARIILTHPKDICRVERILKKTFTVVDQTQHPKAIEDKVNAHTRFRGYNALHIYITLESRPPNPHSNPVIEIQIVTVPIWHYSQLHHDVVYKKHHGEPTKELLLVIELIKGIANVADEACIMYDIFLGQEHYPNVQDRARSVSSEETSNKIEPQGQSDVRLANPPYDMDGANPSIDAAFKDLADEVEAYAIMRNPTATREARLKITVAAHQILLQAFTTSSKSGFPCSRRLRILRMLAIAERRLSLAQDLDKGDILKHLNQAKVYMDEAFRMDVHSESVGAKEQMTMERHIVRGLKAKAESQIRGRNEEAPQTMFHDVAAGIMQALEDLEKIDAVKYEQSIKFANKWIGYFSGV